MARTMGTGSGKRVRGKIRRPRGNTAGTRQRRAFIIRVTLAVVAEENP